MKKNEDLRPLLARGNRGIARQDLKQAKDCAEHARQLAPNSPQLALLLARIANLEEGPARKAEVLRHYLETVGDNHRVRHQLADTLLKLGKYREAHSQAEKVLAGGTKTFAQYMLLGRVCIEEGDYDKARGFLDHARELEPGHPSPVLQLARIANLEEGPARKAEVLRHYLETVGDNHRVRHQLADILLKLGQYREARSQAEKVLAGGTKTFAQYMLLGRVCIEEGDYDKARGFLDHARELEPGHPSPVLQLARIANLEEGPARKAEVLRHYLETVGDNHRVRHQLADTLLKLGKYREARSQAEKVLAGGTKTFAQYMLLGRVCVEEGDYDKARGFLDHARELEPGHPSPVLQLARIANLEEGPARKAEVLSRYLADVNDGFAIRLELANIHINQGQLEEAVQVAQSVEMARCDDHQLIRLAGIFEMCRRDDLSRLCYERLDPQGAYGAGLLLTHVLDKTLDTDAALTIHARQGLPQDNFYRALLAYREKQQATSQTADVSISATSGEPLLDQYLDVPAYYQASPETAANLPVPVSIVAPIHRPEDVDNLLRQLVRQDYPHLEAIIVVNGKGIDSTQMQAVLENSGTFQRVRVLTLPESTSLSSSLNVGFAEATGQYIARFDADDLYQARYISRTIGLMRATSADVCGKSHLFMHFEELGINIVVPLIDQQYTPYRGQQIPGSGSTLAISRAVSKAIQFDESLMIGEDQDFYIRSFSKGFKAIYAPPFDHIVIRKDDKKRHCWRFSDMRLLANCRHDGFLWSGSIENFEKKLESFVKGDAKCD